MGDPLDWLAKASADRVAAGLRRDPRVRPSTPEHLDLASNDYLGLGRDERVRKAAAAAVLEWGAGSTGSRLVTGTTALHVEVEQNLARFVGFEAGFVCSTGYHANLAAVTALSGEDCLIVSDAYNHASLIDACRLSRSRTVVVDHLDVAGFAAALEARTEKRAIVLTDSVFSADGDLADLVALHELARAHGALLIVDESHALGIVGPGGRGGCAAAGIAGEPDVVITAALSKSFGAQGGVILGTALVREHLINAARAIIFETGLNPAALGAVAEALSIIEADPGLPAKARANATRLASITGAPIPDAAVVSVLVGEAQAAVDLQSRLLELGFWVGCFRPPSVPQGTSRLRLTARADLSTSEIEAFAAAFEAATGRSVDLAADPA